MKYNVSFVNLLTRILVLGGIVYLAASYIPSTQLDVHVKLMISLLVVITYSFIDVLKNVLLTTRNKMCDVVC